MNIFSKLNYVNPEDLRKVILNHFDDFDVKYQLGQPRPDLNDIRFVELEMVVLGNLAEHYKTYGSSNYEDKVARSNFFNNIKEIYRFINDIVEYKKKVNPAIIDAIPTFFEQLYFGNHEFSKKAKSLIPRKLLSYISDETLKDWAELKSDDIERGRDYF